MKQGKLKILAVASGGGHWVQMLRLRPAFQGHDVVYVSTHAGCADMVRPARFYAVPDANRSAKASLLKLAVNMAAIMLREKPDIVLSTGAAPGFFSLFFAKVMRAKTIWIDSIANVEELSLSGRRVRRYADLWLTQWRHLARPDGPRYAGAVL